AELGVYCSILLRLPLSPASVPVAALMLGLAVKEAIERTTDLACDLRWPNDVLIKERKVAGVLAQLVDSCLVAGIGINVNHLALPDDLRTPATSLLIESRGITHSREEIVAALLEAIDCFTSMLINQGTDAILRSFTAASSYALNRRVVAEDSQLRGVTAGIDTDGFLLIRSESGSTERVISGGVRPA
ncbi:MAG: biotin--[acetyl-CoA-carboxylase] ligase, partial [Acidobacteriaceae bacterium]|nr:biotin--[acetyl-CoA-carboxylase] ligase [Acidobacteriaceae bacterium]